MLKEVETIALVRRGRQKSEDSKEMSGHIQPPGSQATSGSDAPEGILSHLSGVLMRRLRLVGGIMGVGVTVTFVVSAAVSKIYDSTATLLAPKELNASSVLSGLQWANDRGHPPERRGPEPRYADVHLEKSDGSGCGCRAISARTALPR